MNGAAEWRAIDSLVYMKMRALTKSRRFENQGHHRRPVCLFAHKEPNSGGGGGGGGGDRKRNQPSEGDVERASLCGPAPTRSDAKESRGRRRVEKLRTGRRLCADQRVKGRLWKNKLEDGLKSYGFKINFSLHWMVTRSRAAAHCWHTAIIWPNIELFFKLPQLQPQGELACPLIGHSC